MGIKYKQFLQFLSISFLSLLLIIGCNSTNSSNQLIISAATSLKDVMEEIKPEYLQKYPDTEIIYNFASSGSLQRQIEQGAPVDIFISAATKQIDLLEKQNLLLTETRCNLLKNQMVLIIPENKEGIFQKIDNFDDLTIPEVEKVALGQPESVPAGGYAQEILNHFNIASEINSKAVFAKDVRQVLNYVFTENVDAGMVYHTDALVSDNVKIVAIAPDNSHSPLLYPIAIMKDSKRPEVASQFIEFLNTPESKKVFEKYGFNQPEVDSCL